MSAAAESFWDFSLALYGRPGVAPALIGLQDRLGLDVNMLLYCCWAGIERSALSRDELTTVEALAEPWQGSQVQAVCGIESRGFIFGAALAQKLHAGFVPLRKPGKLPPPLVEVDYALEYGTDRLQARNDALRPGERALIVDDVLATGGTLAAARTLVEKLGGELVGASVLIELDGLRGRERWPAGVPLHALLHY